MVERKYGERVEFTFFGMFPKVVLRRHIGEQIVRLPDALAGQALQVWQEPRRDNPVEDVGVEPLFQIEPVIHHQFDAFFPKLLVAERPRHIATIPAAGGTRCGSSSSWIGWTPT